MTSYKISYTDLHSPLLKNYIPGNKERIHSCSGSGKADQGAGDLNGSGRLFTTTTRLLFLLTKQKCCKQDKRA